MEECADCEGEVETTCSLCERCTRCCILMPCPERPTHLECVDGHRNTGCGERFPVAELCRDCLLCVGCCEFDCVTCDVCNLHPEDGEVPCEAPHTRCSSCACTHCGGLYSERGVGTDGDMCLMCQRTSGDADTAETPTKKNKRIECYFFAQYGKCSTEKCPYEHGPIN